LAYVNPRCRVAFTFAIAAAICSNAIAGPPEDEEKVLNIYNWIRYIGDDTIAGFERETGIRVHYDEFDDVKLLEGSISRGKSGFDVMVPSIQLLADSVSKGRFRALDSSRLTNTGNLDPRIRDRLEQLDPGSTHSIDYLWGTTGIGFDSAKVRTALGNEIPLDSWDLVFKPEYVGKLKDCGVTFVDRASEMVPIALNYLGDDRNSADPAAIARAEALLRSVRPFVRKFDSSEYIDLLASGKVCVVVGWSGDVLLARTDAPKIGGPDITYLVPREGAPIWLDVLAIPADAPHPGNAHRFLDYLLRADVMARIAQQQGYASGNSEANARLPADLRGDSSVFPPAATMTRLFVLRPSTEAKRLYEEAWRRVKSSR
jgi:putrescine transport system substrate-binding protein